MLSCKILALFGKLLKRFDTFYDWDKRCFQVSMEVVSNTIFAASIILPFFSVENLWKLAEEFSLFFA